jgi:APA family basic amino acid/polyamine antiporter
VLAAIGCSLAGLCYSEFATMIPVAGSAYTYAYASFGELWAWIIGWDLILEYAVGAATVAISWSQTLVALLASLGLRFPAGIAASPLQSGSGGGLINLPAVAIVALVSLILIRGIRESATVNSVIVVLKVTVILVFIALGWSYMIPANHTPLIPPNEGEFGRFGWSGILAGAGVMFFAYIGFDAVSTAAQEAKNPRRDLPIGIIVSLLICTVLYIAVAGVLTGMVHWQDVNIEAPIARAFLDRGLSTASHVITLGALAGLTSVMLVMLLGQTRVLYAMANDGLLPKKFFAAVHPKFRTPYKNTMLVGLLAAIVGSITPIDDIGKMVNIGTLLAFVIVCIAVMILRKTNPGQPRPFRTPWVPAVPILGILFNGYMMYKLGWVNWARLIIWLVIGLVIYFTYSRYHSRISNAQQ